MLRSLMSELAHLHLRKSLSRFRSFCFRSTSLLAYLYLIHLFLTFGRNDCTYSCSRICHRSWMGASLLFICVLLLNNKLVTAMAPFAYTYVNGPHPITVNRLKSVGSLGVEVLCHILIPLHMYGIICMILI
jgi:hypothetical protein